MRKNVRRIKKDQVRLRNCITFILMLLWISGLCPIKAEAADNERYYKILDSMMEDYNYAKEHYENGNPPFTEYDREPEVPLSNISSPRYKQDKDGIYRSAMEKDGIATILFTGDLMCQPDQMKEALNKYGCYNFKDNFVYVRDILSSSDFTIGNLETTLSESASYYSEEPLVDDKPHLNAPSTFLDSIRYAGFDMVVTSNNHACDSGLKGIFQTLAHLEQYKLINTGLFKNEREKRYKIVEIDGIKVAFMSYAKSYNTKNRFLTKEGNDVLLNMYSQSRVKKDVSAAKADGAEYIISYIHWGKQFVTEATDLQKQIAQEMADAGVDYIIGSHPHCLMPYDRVTASDGRVVPVIYSMSNFACHMMSREITKESMILQIKLKKNAKGKVVLQDEGYIPCRIMRKYKGNYYTNLPLTSPYNNGNLTGYAKESYPMIRSIISDRLKVLGRFSIKNVDIEQSFTKTTYSGKAKSPAITVTDGLGTKLKRGTDYTITRSNNVLPGISTIKIKGIGEYTGSVTKKLYIRPAKVTNFQKYKEDGKYYFTWDKSTGVDGYYVYLKKPGASSYKRQKKVTSRKISMKIPKESGTYRVKIAAFKETDEETLISPLSTSLSITVK